MSGSNKTIAKNTLFLYFRMLLVMVVSLYTSRVVLQVLGVEDFGTYNSVGGIVLLLSFVNGALATGSSRFLTFELGTGNEQKLKETFSSVLIVHAVLAVIVVLLAETAGLWFVYNKLVIPPERLSAAIFTYHLSVVTIFFSITQVPYNASIISHEKMSIYAYVGIVEVFAKLIVVYALKIGDWDKLKLYALLLCVIQVGIALFYRGYCVVHFVETKSHLILNKKIVKNVLGYSGWNLFANTAIALNNHGSTILINMFFNPAVVAARAVANQVNMAANQFINNFRTAANPQIVKRYAAGDIEGSKSLLLSSTKYSFYLMLLLCLPICLVAEPLLRLWLGQVPEYSVEFLQITIVTSLLQVFDSSFYVALYAKGRIRENAFLSPTIGFLVLPVSYIFFKLGFSPVSIAWCLLVSYGVVGLVVKPILIIKIVGYTWKDIFSVFKPCFNVLIMSSLLPLFFYIRGDCLIESEIVRCIFLVVLGVCSVGCCAWFIGLEKEIRIMLIVKFRSLLSSIFKEMRGHK